MAIPIHIKSDLVNMLKIVDAIKESNRIDIVLRFAVKRTDDYLFNVETSKWAHKQSFNLYFMVHTIKYKNKIISLYDINSLDSFLDSDPSKRDHIFNHGDVILIRITNDSRRSFLKYLVDNNIDLLDERALLEKWNKEEDEYKILYG